MSENYKSKVPARPTSKKTSSILFSFWQW